MSQINLYFEDKILNWRCEAHEKLSCIFQNGSNILIQAGNWKIIDGQLRFLKSKDSQCPDDILIDDWWVACFNMGVIAGFTFEDKING
jgi:hypothetical protein